MMQGEGGEESIIGALNGIYSHAEAWDVVVIIRGGGATSDLSNFDSYLLAANCAQFPLPIITGIGHERDDTVIDAVAHTRVKTPTAAAEYLIARVHESAAVVEISGGRICQAVRWVLEHEKQQLDTYCHRMQMTLVTGLQREHYRLEQWVQHFPLVVRTALEREQHRLQLWEQRVDSLSPDKLLARGYSITLKDGHAVTDATTLSSGDRLVTRMAKGEVRSIVE